MSKSIVVIGASHAGTTFIKTTAPKLPAGWTITVIEPSSHFVWYIGLPRAVVDSEFSKKTLFDYSKIFGKYSNVKLVQGRVTSVDLSAKSVATAAGASFSYDYLVIASGSTAADPWKLLPNNDTPTQHHTEFLSSLQTGLKAAKTVVIAGGGPIGLETAAEIKEHYPSKKVVIVNSQDHLLASGGWSQSTATKLEKFLKSAGVEIKHKTRVNSPTETKASGATVELNDGTSIQADVFISAVGFQPNTSFLPEALLDAKKQVEVLPTLQSKADPSVFAVGDVASFKRKFSHRADAMAATLSTNVLAVTKSPSATLKNYTGDDSAFMGIVQLGTKGGAGEFGWLSFPTFMVKSIKGKDMLVSIGTGRLYA